QGQGRRRQLRGPGRQGRDRQGVRRVRRPAADARQGPVRDQRQGVRVPRDRPADRLRARPGERGVRRTAGSSVVVPGRRRDAGGALGGDPGLGLGVIGWVAPAGPVEDKVNSFTLIGPGRMPVTPELEPVADPTEEAPDAVIAPEAVAGPKTVVADEAEVAPAAAEVSEAEPEPAPAPKPRPTGRSAW